MTKTKKMRLLVSLVKPKYQHEDVESIIEEILQFLRKNPRKERHLGITKNKLLEMLKTSRLASAENWLHLARYRSSIGLPVEYELNRFSDYLKLLGDISLSKFKTSNEELQKMFNSSK